MSAASILHRSLHAPAATPLQLGPYGITSLIDPGDTGAFTAYHVTIAPHQQTSISYHKISEEIYFVLSGSGTAILNGTPANLLPGDFLRLPPGTTHGFITQAEPLTMLDLHSPGSRPDHDVYFVGDPPPGFSAPA